MNDKQDYRQLIADLRTCASYKVPCKYCSRIIGDDCAPELKADAADAIETLLNGIEAYRQAASREWVSVDERLPDMREDILFVVKCSAIAYNGYYDEHKKMFVGFAEFEPRLFVVKDVTHWMPLPEPPEVVE